MHQVRQWLGPVVLLDAASVGSRTHHPRLWWTNLAPLEVLKAAYSRMVRPEGLIVDDILDSGRRSQAIGRNDLPPLAVVNKIGLPRAALLTLVSYLASHAYRQGKSGLVWDEGLQQLVEPNADEWKRAMGFPTGITTVPEFLESIRRQLIGQAMDLNCLSLVLSIGWAEQRRLHSELMLHPFVSLPPAKMVQAAAGGACPSRVEKFLALPISKQDPWTEWDAELEVVAAKVAAVTEELPKEDWGADVCEEGKEIPNPAPTVAA
jgi:hypothetical protein